MSDQSDYLVERVREARALAREATLDNVRANHLRSAAAWEALAQRSLRTDILKSEEAARKAEREAQAAADEAAGIERPPRGGRPPRS
ncbi:hypothetical protein [Sphingomicrobium aestuariivivum]|uniref:hypothetical protein n=1 Tax=Sphingomicrobium aestuariivivum TaxID=1582356 RepID=UPI001FD6E7E1|nr:hypothetical protein [Sphingomicrobium aestuariivivum]MCJ8190408.1 hypothetical protein [Sphingomicrobium aestuariivivum]